MWRHPSVFVGSVEYNAWVYYPTPALKLEVGSHLVMEYEVRKRGWLPDNGLIIFELEDKVEGGGSVSRRGRNESIFIDWPRNLVSGQCHKLV